ncbi:STAS domain-containing protein [Alteromonas sp. CYL-A6]|uniref:STAS domain-containing protein n=1 Tax=Alteromonas nitratireducens TaxID=3390813 RepID=UPI0034C2D22C
MGIETKLNSEETALTIVMDERFDYAKVQDFKEAYSGLPNSVSHIAVNLAKTEYMDSSALGMLLNMQKVLSDRKLTYSIEQCRPRVERILQISRFDKKFTIS